MSITVADLITAAFVNIGYIRPGATITTTMRDAAFTQLLQLMSNWSTEQVMAYVVYHQIFPSGSGGIVAGTSLYTLGTGGTLVATAAPIAVTSAASVSGNQRIPLQVMSWDQFDKEVQDEIQTRSVFAKKLAADQQFPSMNLRVWPTPDTAPATMEINYYSALPVYSTTADTVTLPAGYERALAFALAIELAPQYGRQGGQVPEVLATNAANAKAAIAAKNASILGLAPAAA